MRECLAHDIYHGGTRARPAGPSDSSSFDGDSIFGFSEAPRAARLAWATLRYFGQHGVRKRGPELFFDFLVIRRPLERRRLGVRILAHSVYHGGTRSRPAGPSDSSSLDVFNTSDNTAIGSGAQTNFSIFGVPPTAVVSPTACANHSALTMSPYATECTASEARRAERLLSLHGEIVFRFLVFPRAAWNASSSQDVFRGREDAHGCQTSPTLFFDFRWSGDHFRSPRAASASADSPPSRETRALASKPAEPRRIIFRFSVSPRSLSFTARCISIYRCALFPLRQPCTLASKARRASQLCRIIFQFLAFPRTLSSRCVANAMPVVSVGWHLDRERGVVAKRALWLAI
ncbi:hypothetical protein PLICRDRAFT_700517 [Plicaturopsis crispa FD-325 SS-3]|nr:hypothetical protein PLICRDRAFT_700517 [Plicaturopsis crispa FD-325 SS-3]